MDKTTLLWAPGTYGEYTLRLFNNNYVPINVNEYGVLKREVKNTHPKRKDHHLIQEEQVDTHTTKITYEKGDENLINRNKWFKLQEHLEEQANLTYPNSKNKKIYTIAINKCNLLDQNNIFRKITRDTTLEIKFKTYLESASKFANIFEQVFEQLRISFNKNLIISSHSNFLKGQEEIFQNHKTGNDIFAEGNILGEKYYQQYGLNFNESNFDKIYKG
jgi:hypothetical protein